MGMGTSLRVILALLFGLVSANLFGETNANTAIYNFCIRHEGQQVGDGVCHTLVDEALRSAGLPPNYHPEKEVWRIASTSHGVVIQGDFNKVLPGDIIYFNDIFQDRYRFKGEAEASLYPERPKENHIGVVDSISIDGVRYFNQNSSYQKKVKSDYFPFGNNLDIVDYIAIFRP